MEAKNGVFLVVIFTFFIFSMKLYSQTTQEEYNYVTKGYPDQIDKGLDMKKGYHFVDLNENSVTTGTTVRSCKFKALMREGQTKPCAILCIYSRSDNGFKDYLCIPTYDAPKEIWDQAFEKFKTYSETGATALIWGIAKLSSYYAAK